MTGAVPGVSVVIPTFGRRDALPATLAPLLADDAVGEVVVVVDGCDDGSYELLQDLQHDHPRLVPISQENGGAAAARQAGVEHATCEVVLVLDDDVVAGPGLASGHARHHVDASDRLVVGFMPTVVPARRPGTFATALYAREYLAHCCRWEREPATILTSLWLGNISLRRDAALRVGFVSPIALHGYHDDRDFGIRCARAGLTGVFDRRLRADHHHHRELAAFRRDARSQGASMQALVDRYGAAAGPADGRAGDDPPFEHRLLVAAARFAPVAAPLCEVLAGVVVAAGHSRAYRVEDLAARALRRLEQQRGARHPPASWR